MSLIECPSCTYPCGIPVVYGKPTPQLQKAAEFGLVRLSGCIRGRGDPSFACVSCGTAWGHSPYESLVSTATWFWQNTFEPAVSEFGEFCVAYGRTERLSQGERTCAFGRMMESSHRARDSWDNYVAEMQGTTDSTTNHMIVSTAHCFSDELDRAISAFGEACMTYGQTEQSKPDDRALVVSRMMETNRAVRRSWDNYLLKLQHTLNVMRDLGDV